MIEFIGFTFLVLAILVLMLAMYARGRILEIEKRLKRSTMDDKLWAVAGQLRKDFENDAEANG